MLCQSLAVPRVPSLPALQRWQCSHCKLAYAHGPAEWIQRGGFKNAAGELCCGERDCFELTDADVKITSAGYYVVSIKETVPFSEATPSPDGRYWRCQWGGSRKCFFAPPSAT
jgi:hypothetical protein